MSVVGALSPELMTLIALTIVRAVEAETIETCDA